MVETITLRTYLDELDEMMKHDSPTSVVRHCQYILSHFPQNVETYRLLGQALLRKGQHEGNLEHVREAVEVFQRVLSVLPADISAHRGLSEAYQELNESERAIWHLERAFEQSPGDAELQESLRDHYVKRGGNDAPEKVQLTRTALARQYINGQLYDQALVELRRALQQLPQRIDIQVILAQTLWDSQHPVEAGEVAVQVLKRLPNCLPAHRIMAQLWLSYQRPSDAQRFLDRLAALDPYAAAGILQPAGAVADSNTLPRFDYDAYAQSTLTSETPDWVQSLGDPDSAGPSMEDAVRLGGTASFEDTGPDRIDTEALFGGGDLAATPELETDSGLFVGDMEEATGDAESWLPTDFDDATEPNLADEHTVADFEAGTMDDLSTGWDSDVDAADRFDVDSGLPDWDMSGAGDLAEQDDVTGGSAPDGGIMPGLDELYGTLPADTEAPAEAGDVPEWLMGGGQAEDISGLFDSEAPLEGDVSDSASDDPEADWLTEAAAFSDENDDSQPHGQPDQYRFGETTAEHPGADAAADDWLSGGGVDDLSALLGAVSDPEETAQAEDVPAWLSADEDNSQAFGLGGDAGPDESQYEFTERDFPETDDSLLTDPMDSERDLPQPDLADLFGDAGDDSDEPDWMHDLAGSMDRDALPDTSETASADFDALFAGVDETQGTESDVALDESTVTGEEALDLFDADSDTSIDALFDGLQSEEAAVNREPGLPMPAIDELTDSDTLGDFDSLFAGMGDASDVSDSDEEIEAEEGAIPDNDFSGVAAEDETLSEDAEDWFTPLQADDDTTTPEARIAPDDENESVEAERLLSQLHDSDADASVDDVEQADFATGEELDESVLSSGFTDLLHGSQRTEVAGRAAEDEPDELADLTPPDWIKATEDEVTLHDEVVSDLGQTQLEEPPPIADSDVVSDSDVEDDWLLLSATDTAERIASDEEREFEEAPETAADMVDDDSFGQLGADLEPDSAVDDSTVSDLDLERLRQASMPPEDLDFDELMSSDQTVLSQSVEQPSQSLDAMSDEAPLWMTEPDYDFFAPTEGAFDSFSPADDAAMALQPDAIEPTGESALAPDSDDVPGQGSNDLLDIIGGMSADETGESASGAMPAADLMDSGVDDEPDWMQPFDDSEATDTFSTHATENGSLRLDADDEDWLSTFVKPDDLADADVVLPVDAAPEEQPSSSAEPVMSFADDDWLADVQDLDIEDVTPEHIDDSPVEDEFSISLPGEDEHDRMEEVQIETPDEAATFDEPEEPVQRTPTSVLEHLRAAQAAADAADESLDETLDDALVLEQEDTVTDAPEDGDPAWLVDMGVAAVSDDDHATQPNTADVDLEDSFDDSYDPFEGGSLEQVPGYHAGRETGILQPDETPDWMAAFTGENLPEDSEADEAAWNMAPRDLDTWRDETDSAVGDFAVDADREAVQMTGTPDAQGDAPVSDLDRDEVLFDNESLGLDDLESIAPDEVNSEVEISAQVDVPQPDGLTGDDSEGSVDDDGVMPDWLVAITSSAGAEELDFDEFDESAETYQAESGLLQPGEQPDWLAEFGGVSEDEVTEAAAVDSADDSPITELDALFAAEQVEVSEDTSEDAADNTDAGSDSADPMQIFEPTSTEAELLSETEEMSEPAQETLAEPLFSDQLEASEMDNLFDTGDLLDSDADEDAAFVADSLVAFEEDFALVTDLAHTNVNKSVSEDSELMAELDDNEDSELLDDEDVPDDFSFGDLVPAWLRRPKETDMSASVQVPPSNASEPPEWLRDVSEDDDDESD